MKIKSFFIVLFISFQLLAQHDTKSVGFTENKGQLIDQKGKPNKLVKYLLNTNGLNVQLRKNGFSYDVYETKKHPVTEKQREAFSLKKGDTLKQPNYTLEYIYHRIDIDFSNSNPNVELLAEGKSSDYDNYYNVAHAPNGVLDVHKFEKITYQNIYPKIDIVFFIPEDKLKPVEYNFIVKPGGKTSDIQLKFKGAETELLDNKIKMTTRFGEMEETLPMSWVMNGNDKKDVALGYRKIKNDVYGFESSENLDGKKVVIDPVPVRLWGTYVGGEAGTSISHIINDTNHDLVVSGLTGCVNLATAGTYQQTLWTSGNSNIPYNNGFIAKFNPLGERIWGTFIGSNEGFQINDLANDSSNNIVLTGNVFSPINNLTTPNCYQPVMNYQYYSGNNYECFLVKFSEFGQLIWGTYYGGKNNDVANSVTTDGDNNIIISGMTYSETSIASNGAHKTTFSNDAQTIYNGFIAKFTPNGNRVWGTYFGGKLQDEILESAVDDANNIYLVGRAGSLEGIATKNAFQPSRNKLTDGFITKFSPDGSQIWGTYFGGESEDQLSSIDVSLNNVYVLGKTGSSTNISTKNSFLENAPKTGLLGYDGIIAKFDITGNRIWSSYFYEEIEDLDVDNDNNVFLIGNTTKDTEIATQCAFKETKKDYYDIYIQKFNTNGGRVWGTYYGGNTLEVSGKIAYDKFNKKFYITGTTDSSDGIATPNSFLSQHTKLVGSDGFIVKFQDYESEVKSNSPICIGSNLNLTATGGAKYTWTGPNGFTSALQNPIIPNAKAIQSGKYSCTISDINGCDTTITIDVLIGDNAKPIPDVTTLPIITGDCKTVISTIPIATDNCAGKITATTTDPLSYSLPGTYTIHWKYDDGNGNSSTQNQTTIITSQPLPTITSPQSFCIQQNATINNISITGQNIKWYDALSSGKLLLSTTLLQSGITYYASQTINGCESDRVPVLVNIIDTSAPTGNSPQSFCVSQNPTLSNIAVSGMDIKWYDKAVLGNALSYPTPLVNGATYYASQTLNNCESPNRLAVSVNLINQLPANAYSATICDNLNDGTETVNLNNYNTDIIVNPSDYSFKYYTSLSDAENDLSSIQDSDKLNLGESKIYVRVTFNNNCYKVVELKLTVIPSPVINLQDTYSLCQNDYITIKADTGFDSYLWSTGETSAAKKFDTIGNYSLTATKNNGTVICWSTKNIQVVLSNVATISNIETQDWSDNQNKIKVFVTGAGDYEYSTDGIHFQDSNEFSELSNGEYKVYVRDKNGCGTITDEVYLLMYPRFFTPNADGYNDTWTIKLSSFEPNMKVAILDRYSKFIKQLDHENDTWDGRYNGHDLPSDDYWFVVTRANGKEYKGHFSLKR